MKENKVWLKISVFYSRESLHSLMKMAVQPFLQKMANDRLITNYFVFLGYDQGDHLKISMETIRQNLELLDQNIYQYLILFLKNHPCEVSKSEKKKGFFKDFPPNSLQYNLYKHSICKIMLEDEIRNHISDTLLKVFSKEIISDESLLSFVIYIQLSLIRIFYPNRKDRIDRAIIVANKLLTKIGPIEGTFLKNEADLLFNQNQDTFQEILFDVFNHNTRSGDLEWLISWERFCKTAFVSEGSDMEKHVYFIKMVYNHLSMTDYKHLILTSQLALKSLKLKAH